MRYVNAADARYAPTPERPSRLHNAWADVEAGTDFYTPYGEIGAYRLPNDDPLVVDKPGVTIRGDGRMGEDVGWVACSRNGSVLKIAAPNVRVADLCISRWFWNEASDGTAGAGCGILCEHPNPIWGLLVERVNIHYMGRNAIRFAGETAQGYQVGPRLESVVCYGSGAEGFYGRAITAMTGSVHATHSGGRGIMLEDTAGGTLHAVAESNAGDYQLVLTRCDSMEIRGWWEDHAGRRAVLVEGSTGCRLGGRFGGWGGTGSIRLGAGTRRCVITASTHYGSPVAVEEADSSVTGNVIEPQEGAPVRVSARRNRVL